MNMPFARAFACAGRLGAALLAVIMVASVVTYAPKQASATEPERFLYGVSGLGTQAVTEIDLVSSSATGAGFVTAESEAIDLDPATGRLYYYEWETTATTFGYFDPDTGGNVTVRTYAPPVGVRMTRMAFDPSGQLFMMDVDDRLYSIDHLTGDVTDLGTVNGLIRNGFRGTGDMAFAPDGTLYVAVERRLYEVDAAALQATLLHSGMIPVSGVGLTLWTGLAFCDGQMYASNAEGSTGRSGIFSIDPVSGAESLEFYAGPAFRDLASCLPAPNTAPVAADDDLVTDEGTSITITLSASDADGDALIYTVSDPADGELTGTAPDLTYTPDAGFSGTDSFTFTANDGRDDSNTATVTITVNDVNVAPVASDATVSTDQDSAIGITLSATDADGDALIYTVSDPADGELTGTAPDLTYTPDAGFFGTDSFTFTANDGEFDSNTATVTVEVTSTFSTPAAPGNPVGVGSDGQVSLSWTAPIDDGGAEIVDYVTEFAPVGGEWTAFDDGIGTATTAVVPGLTNYDEYRFRVAAVNAVGAGATSAETTATPTDGNDPDETFNHPDGPLSGRPEWERVDPATIADMTIVDGHAEGTGDPDGTASSWASPIGPDLEVTLDATLGDSYNEASVLLRMNNTVEYTSAYLLQWVTDGDQTALGSIAGPTAQIWRLDPGPVFVLLAEAALPDNGERTLTFSAQGPELAIREGGTVHLTATDSTYPTGDYFAIAQADLSGGGAASQLDNVRFRPLAAPNVAPVAVDGSVSTDEGVAVGVTLSASDADGDALTYTVGVPANGQVTGTAPDLTYTPDPDFFGSDSFTFSVSDGEADSNTATVSIAVVEVPDPNVAPVAVDGSVSTDEGVAVGVTLSASDADGDALTYTVGVPANGQISGVAPDLTYTPDPDFFGSDSFTFSVSDGEADSNTATVTVTVVEVPDPNVAPVAVDGSVSTDEGVPVGVTLSASDADGDALTYTVGDPANGQISGVAPDLTYTPDPDFFGSDSFTFSVSDGEADSNTATVTVTVVEVPDPNVAPVAVDGSVSTDEGVPVGVTLSASDADGDALTYTVGDPANGQISGVAPDLTYTPDPDFFGTDSFTFSVSDGEADSNTATVTVTVVEVPDPNVAPVAVDGSVSTDEGVPVGVTLSASDADGDALTYTVGVPANGQISGVAPDLTYTPDPDFFGTDSFTFSVNDAEADSNTATITITVVEVPDVRQIWSIDPFGQMRSTDVADGATQAGAGTTLGSHAIDRDPTTGLIYSLEWGSSGDEFATWDPATGATDVIRVYAPSIGFSATQMAFAPDGTLYVIDGMAQLHTIDPANGDITGLGAITGLASGVHGQIGDLTFGPDGTAYVATYGDLYTLDIGTRTASVLHTDMFGTPLRLWLGLTFCDGSLYGSDVRGGTFRSTIYRIDIGTGAIDSVHTLPTYITDLAGCAP